MQHARALCRLAPILLMSASSLAGGDGAGSPFSLSGAGGVGYATLTDQTGLKRAVPFGVLEASYRVKGVLDLGGFYEKFHYRFQTGPEDSAAYYGMVGRLRVAYPSQSNFFMEFHIGYVEVDQRKLSYAVGPCYEAPLGSTISLRLALIYKRAEIQSAAFNGSFKVLDPTVGVVVWL